MENKTKYRDQILKWEQDMHALRKKYRSTPVGYQSERQETEAENSLKTLENRVAETKKLKIQNPPISQEQMFAGRKKELQQIEKILKEEHRVLLYGIGGIGKSSLALFYGYEKQKQGMRVLFLTCQRNILEMIVSDAQLMISNCTYNARQYRSKRAYFRAKIHALTEIAKKEHLLLIVDNFNLEKDRYLKELLEVPCDFIFTSRIVPELFGKKSQMLVQGIAEEEWDEFCRLYLRRAYPEDKILEKRKEVRNHPLFMKLYLFMLNGENSEQKNERVQKGATEILKPLQGLGLKKQEKLFLLWMSLLPVEGISGDLFCLICGIEKKQLERLLQWNLLEQTPQGEEGWKIRIHSVIAGDICKQLSPSYGKCRFFLERFAGYLGGKLNGIETWNRSYAENARLVEPALCLTEKFRNPPEWMLKEYDEFATLFWVQGYFDEAEKIVRRSFERAVADRGEGDKLTAYLAGRVAAVYYNRSMHTDADQWYRKSLECFEQIPEAEITEEVARDHMDILTKLQRKAWLEDDHEAADRYYHKAMRVEQLREAVGAKSQQELLFGKRCVQYVRMYYALSLSRRGQAEQAEKLMQEGMSEPQIKNSRFCSMEFRYNYARVLYEKSHRLPKDSGDRKKGLRKAEQIMWEVIENTRKFRGTQYYYIQRQKELLADILLAEGREAEGTKVLEEILGVLQEYFPYDREWTEQVMKKFRSVGSEVADRTKGVTEIL